ncbi:MAG: hypothetical protein ACYDBJ_27830 [Aggregatilineales bacterium]
MIEVQLTAQGILLPIIRVQQVSSILSASGKTPLIQSQVRQT